MSALTYFLFIVIILFDLVILNSKDKKIKELESLVNARSKSLENAEKIIENNK